eukprot:Nk52_evm81s2118 gene=Nk52_evmTU81s2118
MSKKRKTSVEEIEEKLHKVKDHAITRATKKNINIKEEGPRHRKKESDKMEMENDETPVEREEFPMWILKEEEDGSLLVSSSVGGMYYSGVIYPVGPTPN